MSFRGGSRGILKRQLGYVSRFLASLEITEKPEKGIKTQPLMGKEKLFTRLVLRFPLFSDGIPVCPRRRRAASHPKPPHSTTPCAGRNGRRKPCAIRILKTMCGPPWRPRGQWPRGRKRRCRSRTPPPRDSRKNVGSVRPPAEADPSGSADLHKNHRDKPLPRFHRFGPVQK
jgi:hypothetical protein